MSDIKFIYVTLKVINFIVFIIYGFILSKCTTKREYWTKAMVPILVYAIVEGLRFGRMVDWNGYYLLYNGLGEDINYENTEFIFKWACHICYNIGIPYFMFITIQCTLFMTAIFAVLSNYKNQLLFILPMVLSTIIPNANLIRWYSAFIFVLLSINAIVKEDKKMIYIWYLCALLTHSGWIILAPIIPFYKRLNKQLTSPQIYVGLLFATCFLSSISSLSVLVNIADFISSTGILSSSDKLSGYLSNTDAMLAGERGFLMEKSILNQLKTFITYAPILWYGPKCIHKYRCGYFFYNITALVGILMPLFSQVEILSRMCLTLNLVTCISGGILFYEVWLRRHRRSLVVLSACMVSFMAIAFVPYFNSISIQLKAKDEFLLYIWDADGRDYLYNYMDLLDY